MPVGAEVGHAVGPNRITNWGSRLCLDVGHYGNLYENGVRMQQWGCSGDSRQVWNFIVTANPHNRFGYKSAMPAAGSAWTSRTAGMPIGRQCSNGTAEQATSRQARHGTSIRPYRRESSPRSAAGASTSPADRSSRAPIGRPNHCTANNAAQVFRPRVATRWLRKSWMQDLAPRIDLGLAASRPGCGRCRLHQPVRSHSLHDEINQFRVRSWAYPIPRARLIGGCRLKRILITEKAAPAECP
jgi:hypothetical protein